MCSCPEERSRSDEYLETSGLLAEITPESLMQLWNSLTQKRYYDLPLPVIEPIFIANGQRERPRFKQISDLMASDLRLDSIYLKTVTH